ncbi:MAG: trypsin-like peptidase domain-containing protein [Nitrospira sp.]|nr:trypsin-like peptidase domain-containing protein [Nitrospira sp.]MBX3348969.1 trypsin-like peptidase domain-containing protein [Nitrospira sp.]
MEILSKAYAEASQRLATKHTLRDETYRQVQQKNVRSLDPERIPRRVDRLLKNPLIANAFRERGVLDELRKTSSLRDLSEAAQSELERVILGNDFMPAWFLSRGADLRRTVARVRARTSSGQDQKGTGFLAGPRLLLTNFHVLDWTDIGGAPLGQIVPQSLIELDYEEQFNGTMQQIATFRLDPATLLMVSPWDQLDYVLVAVQERSNDGTVSLDTFGYNRLTGDLGKITKGEPVFIVQHPNGQPKQVVLSNNRLIDIDEAQPYLTYEADTDRGSSGSPVYNRQWEVVGLHHSPEIARDNGGQILAKDGTVWQPGMGSGEIKYLQLNEGIRISRIVNDLGAKLNRFRENGLSAVGNLERCSPQGIELLSACLQTHTGGSPTALVAPPASRKDRVPRDQRTKRGPQGRFSTPE